LRTIAAGSVALAVVALIDVAAWIARAVDSTDLFPELPWWERLVVDGPSFFGPLIGLAAVVLMLSLPVAPRFDRSRTAVRWMVCITAIVNMAASIGWVLYAWNPEPRVFARGAVGTFLGVLPENALSAVLLCLAVSSGRWAKRDAADSEQQVSDPPAELDLPEYLNG
jgi:hypothetical protein